MAQVSRWIGVGVFALTLLFVAAPRANASGCNLYLASSSCTFNGGIFDVVGPHPSSGVIQSFLKIQQKGAEEGFNTSTAANLCDGRACDDTTNTSLFSTAVPIVNIGGVAYREFFLDISEPANGTNHLTLDQVEIYVSNTAGLTTHTSVSPGYGALTGATKVYDMETGSADNFVNLDYILVGGTGHGDMLLYVPDSSAFSTNQYVYLYSEFGCGVAITAATSCGTTKFASSVGQNGYAEWWTPTSGIGPQPAPEPGTYVLVATGLALLARRRRRR